MLGNAPLKDQFSLSFDCIHVIESLNSYELKTGTNLVEKVLAPLAKQGGPEVSLHSPTTAEKFIQTLMSIAEETRSSGRTPILHFELHGCEDGVGVSSKELVTWNRLKGALTEINLATKMNLLVVMASCKGAHIIKTVWPTDRSPVWAFIGPTENQYDIDLEESYSRFYCEFLTKLDGRKALEELNDAMVGQPWQFRFYNARFIFRIVFHGYLKQFCTPKVLDRREKQMIDELKATISTPECGWPDLRKRVRTDLEDHEEHFKRISRYFFMLDLYPENTPRFPLTLEECKRHPSEDEK